MIQRIEYLDVENALYILKDAQKKAVEAESMMSEEPGKVTKGRLSLLAGHYNRIAMNYYALGFPLTSVKEAFAKSALAKLRMFENRDKASSFSVVHLQVDPSRSLVVEKPDEPEPDHSLTNSQEGYTAVCEAMLAGLDKIAERIAKLIWDPPNAPYIGKRSFCTPDDQRLAYALRLLFCGGEREVNLSGLIQGRGTVAENVIHQASMVQAICEYDFLKFRDGLTELLEWHRRAAKLKQNECDSDFYLCVSGLGLSAIAIRRGICKIEDLPQRNVFFPIEILDQI